MDITRRSFAAAGFGTLGAVLAAGLQGCAAQEDAYQGSASAGGSSQVIVAMNTGSEPAAGFDPLVAWGCGEHVHEPLIQSTLITTDENLEFAGDLATEYSCTEDGLTWTFKLRDDARFSDGEPLDADDVAFGAAGGGGGNGGCGGGTGAQVHAGTGNFPVAQFCIFFGQHLQIAFMHVADL